VRILAIETATSACSVALIEDGRVIASDMAIVGRGHAERLMPMIADLPDGGRADAIRVDCGPGSFTGIRVGIAAARGLGFGWGVPVHGFSSLALIAATWFASHDDDLATVIIEGGHGEVFVQPFAANPLRETAPFRSVASEAATGFSGVLIGNAAAKIAALTGGVRFGDCDPDARNALLLGDAPLPVRPIYGRAPDAQPMTA
jgi:tRNA threonylcarbamoyladenosine biosynthesis protein TsaB